MKWFVFDSTITLTTEDGHTISLNRESDFSGIVIAAINAGDEKELRRLANEICQGIFVEEVRAKMGISKNEEVEE